jgi:hypothetical protein
MRERDNVTCIISGMGVLAGVTGGGNFFMKSIGFSSAVCEKKEQKSSHVRVEKCRRQTVKRELESNHIPQYSNFVHTKSSYRQHFLSF